MSFFNFQFWIEIEMRKNALFHFNFNLKIEWHFRCGARIKYLPFFRFDYWIEKGKIKKTFCWIYFDLKPILKNKHQNFRINFLIWYQKMNFKKFFLFSIFALKLKTEKGKIFKIRFVFKSKNELYFRYTDSSGTQIIEITFPVIFTSMVSHVIQEQVRIMSIEISRCTMITRAPSICCLENNWFILIFISLAATFTNHISRSSYREVFS